ncbi:unnamed protein product, partial [Ectocarpus sp. 13 AM-2016]
LQRVRAVPHRPLLPGRTICTVVSFISASGFLDIPCSLLFDVFSCFPLAEPLLARVFSTHDHDHSLVMVVVVVVGCLRGWKIRLGVSLVCTSSLCAACRYWKGVQPRTTLFDLFEHFG